MKGMGIQRAGTRTTKDVQHSDYSEDYDPMKNYGSIQGVTWEVSSISMSTDRNLKNVVVKKQPDTTTTDDDFPKEEYNPFDTDSFKKRERHSTFHGWGNQKRGAVTSSTMGQDKGVLSRPDPFNIEENQTSSAAGNVIKTSKTDDNIPRPVKPRSRTTSTSTNDPTKANASLPNLSAAGGAQGKGPQPAGQQGDPFASRSMDVFPRELMINPEYRSLLDTASRHIRLISNQKKKQEEEEKRSTDIPSVTSISPPGRHTRDEFSGSDGDWDDYDAAPASPTGSEKDMLNKDKKGSEKDMFKKDKKK
jgi:hypothetical protein